MDIICRRSKSPRGMTQQRIHSDLQVLRAVKFDQVSKHPICVSTSKPCKSEGQVLRGLLQKTKFYEVLWFTWFYRAQPFFPSMLNLTWTPFETVDAWLGSIQSPTDHSPEWAFPSCNEQPLRLTFRSICKSNSWRFPSRNYMFGRNFHTEKMVPRVSRSVHGHSWSFASHSWSFAGHSWSGSRSVHARFTLAILGPW